MAVVLPNDSISSKPRWKCPDCGLINSRSLDRPCAACFWTISAKEKLLLNLVNSKDRNSKISCLLLKHIDLRDVVQLILEFDPTNSLLDCSAALGEGMQGKYLDDTLMEMPSAMYFWPIGDPNKLKPLRITTSAESKRVFQSLATADVPSKDTKLEVTELYRGFYSYRNSGKDGTGCRGRG